VGGVWTFYVEPGVSRFLPLPGSYGVLRLREPVPVQTNAGHRLVAFRTEPMTMTAFQLDEVDLAPVLADARFTSLLKSARTSAPAKNNDQYRYDPLASLRGPAGPLNQEVLARLVREITGGAELPAAEFGRRATAWLQAHHAYTLAVKLPPGEGKDDIVRWLDSNEPGFCEYFAAGFTVLARTAGYPTRVIAGFHGGVLNGFENYFMVRNSDAHAWTEIYDGTSAWLRVDPTPGAVTTASERNAAAERQVQDSSWSARMDSLRVLWYRRIVNFDSRAQVQMIDQVKSFTTDTGQILRARLEDFTKRLRAWLARPWDLARAGRLGGRLLGAAALLWSLVWLGRSGWRRWQAWRRPDRYDPVRREAGRWLARVRAVPEAGEVVADLRRLRYGRRETWPEPRGVFKRARRVRR